MLLCVTPSPAVDRTALVPKLVLGQILRPSQVLVLPGGKGINAARTAWRMGALVTTTGFAGGHAGRWLIEALAAEGLSPRFVDVDPETRTTYVTVDAGGRSATVYEPAAALAGADLERLLGLLRSRLLGMARRVVVAGSLPPGLAGDGYARLVSVCHEASRPVLIDVAGAPLRAALAAAPDVVKVGVAEALAAGFVGSAPAMARDMAAAGAGLAVVTDGARGASAATADGQWDIAVPRIRAVNAVGSGDAFNAGLSLALDDGASVPEALAYGAAAGVANAESLGAGMVDAGRVRDLLPLIRVTSTAAR